LVIIVHLVIHWDESWLLGGVECVIYAIAGLLSGQIKLPHFSPAGSCGPLRIRVSLMACTVTLVAVKVTVQPASQNLPMLTRLLVNVGIIWPVSVSLGSPGRSNAANAENINNCHNDVPMNFVGVVMSMLVTEASGIKKFPLAPVSVMAVAEGGRLEVELGGLQVHAVAINTMFLLVMLVATASTSPPSHVYVSHPLYHSFPPLVSALVASFLCPFFLLVQVALECPGLHMYPWYQ
jgi:hypothetical protein